MSTVLQFKVSTRRPPGRGLPHHACEIVIFPGIRIERHAEPVVAESERPSAVGADSATPVSRTR